MWGAFWRDDAGVLPDNWTKPAEVERAEAVSFAKLDAMAARLQAVEAKVRAICRFL